MIERLSNNFLEVQVRSWR